MHTRVEYTSRFATTVTNPRGKFRLLKPCLKPQSVSKYPEEQRRTFYRMCQLTHPTVREDETLHPGLATSANRNCPCCWGEGAHQYKVDKHQSTSVSVSGNTMPRSEETKLLIPKEDELAPHQWVGMPIQQLLDYSNDPFWVRLRQCCFVFFWCAFSMLCVSVLVLIVTAPRCQTIEWWQEGPMYGVFAHDFRKDNTSDAKGLSGTYCLFRCNLQRKRKNKRKATQIIWRPTGTLKYIKPYPFLVRRYFILDPYNILSASLLF